MNKLQPVILVFIVFLLVVSAIGYIFFAPQMFAIVGIKATKEISFLGKTLAAALLAFVPLPLAIFNKKSDLRWAILLSLALYMFFSSIADLFGYFNSVVNSVSLPSIAFRVILGILLLNMKYSKK